MLAYDSGSGVLLLADGDDAILVDISLCLDPSRALPWLREENTTVIVAGYLELIQVRTTVCCHCASVDD